MRSFISAMFRVIAALTSGQAVLIITVRRLSRSVDVIEVTPFNCSITDTYLAINGLKQHLKKDLLITEEKYYEQ